MQNYKPKKIIFVGIKNPLLKFFSKENETEVVSSVSFLSVISVRFVPDLIVFDDVSDADILAVRKIDKLVKVPVLISCESFKDRNNFSSISSFMNVIVCNDCVSKSDAFVEHLELLMNGKKKLLSAKTSSIVKYTILYINKNFSKKITRENLAEHSNVAPDYLTRIFKKEMGVGLWEYLNLLRLSNAKNLLTYTGLKIKDVARECGFPDCAYFINVYRKFYGMAPGEVRK